MMPGPVELAIVAVIAVLIFGKRLPGIARSVGSSFVEFKRGLKVGLEDPVQDFKEEAEEIRREIKG